MIIRLSVFAALVLIAIEGAWASARPLRHSRQWVTQRLADMVAMDEAYLYNDVLGGRAIHQNSMTNPPTEPWEGNFHTQQQSYYALVKMELYEQGRRKEPRLLDQARDLLDWVVRNGYDAAGPGFYLKYSTKSGTWEKRFYAEFNMINVAALLCYDRYRRSPEWKEIAEKVLARIVETDAAFKPGAGKNLYGSGYLALKLLDCYDCRREQRFLTLARQVVDLADEALWDHAYGGWFIDGKAGGPLPRFTTKFTHVNANMIQACLRLYRLRQGDRYREKGLAGLRFLADHNRSPDGGWYRHNTRNGADPTRPPGIGDGGTTEPGTPCVYDRMAQVIVACCLAWESTRDPKYLRWVDETLDKMEKTHLTTYPVGVNYGYTRAGDYQNTWCHLWGLKAFLQMARLWSR